MGEVHDLVVPNGSIYLWMYSQGLKHVDIADIEQACFRAGIEIRPKDYENYWNGWYRSDIYVTDNWTNLFKFKSGVPSLTFEDIPWSDYPEHPYMDQPEITKRWVPCNAANKPMIKWGDGCMEKVDAEAMVGQVYLAENTVGMKQIVIDCDGDHDKKLDMDTINFLWRYVSMTHCLVKPKSIMEYEGYEDTNDPRPASFHLTFSVDKVVPTMHLPWCHMDIIGNKRNSLRYFKNKQWNGRQPAMMTDEIWSELQEFSKRRR